MVRVPVSPEDQMLANSAAVEGDIAFARKELYPALIKYLESVRLDPNRHDVYNKLGITYSRLGYYSNAIAAFERSIGLNPKYPYSYNNLGTVYFATQNKKKAEKYFRKAISIKGDDASFHINLGTLLWENKKMEQGLEELQRGLALDPKILENAQGNSLEASSTETNTKQKSYFMARLFASRGDVDVAVEKLQQALNSGFTDLDALQSEHDFDPIRKTEKFIAFMKYAIQLIKSSPHPPTMPYPRQTRSQER